MSFDRGRRVWDLPVRCAHWLLVLAVSGCWISASLSGGNFRWHEYCGYTVLVLVCFRLLWGVVGTRHARFAQFLRGPRELLRYARKVASASTYRPSIGHNPIGGWAVVTMLLLLLAEAGTGLFANDEILHTGPLFGWVSESASDALTKIHGRIFHVLQVIVGLHITAAALYFFVRHDNLVLPMLTGRKPRDVVPESEQIHGSRPWFALGIVVVLAAALALAIRLAPEASLSIF
ncbi:MAG: cytochrome b/b6 domain-containing protein [Steroidobacterales bacterium]